MSGGCGCGAVRFEVDQPFLAAGYCHCTRCQRRSGTAASANGNAASGAVRVVQGEEELRAWAPEGGREKVFCGRCGSALFTRDPGTTDHTGVRLGRDRRRPRDPAAVPAVRRLRRRLGDDSGRRPDALRRVATALTAAGVTAGG